MEWCVPPTTICNRLRIHWINRWLIVNGDWNSVIAASTFTCPQCTKSMSPTDRQKKRIMNDNQLDYRVQWWSHLHWHRTMRSATRSSMYYVEGKKWLLLPDKSENTHNNGIRLMIKNHLLTKKSGNLNSMSNIFKNVIFKYIFHTFVLYNNEWRKKVVQTNGKIMDNNL